MVHRQTLFQSTTVPKSNNKAKRPLFSNLTTTVEIHRLLLDISGESGELGVLDKDNAVRD